MTTEQNALSTALGLLVKQPLNQANEDVLVRAAKAFWYSNISLEAEVRCFLEQERTVLELRRAGYLLERFTRFTCLTDERAEEGLSMLSRLFPSLRKGEEARSDKRGVDHLALFWGLQEGLGLKVQAMLPYQTRHYMAERRQEDGKQNL